VQDNAGPQGVQGTPAAGKVLLHSVHLSHTRVVGVVGVSGTTNRTKTM